MKKSSGTIFSWIIILMAAGFSVYFIAVTARNLEREDFIGGPSQSSSQNENQNVNGNQNGTDENQNIAPEPTETLYRNAAYDFTLLYPSQWQVRESSSGTGTGAIQTVTWSGNGQSVVLNQMDTSQESMVRESMTVSQETTITVGGVSAVKLTGSDLKKGEPLYSIIVKRGETLYNIQSTSESALDQMAASLAFLDTH